jgi:ferrochelatase
MSTSYDALLVVSFGGPDAPDDVVPFLENVLRGRDVPRERMLEVAEHYYRFGGKSPLNEQNRQLIAALSQELAEHGPRLPIYWGNRNWRPLLPDTLRQMAGDGVRRALAFVTSAYSSYSGCRQYREDIARAQREVGTTAPHVDKLRVFFNHPGFIEAQVDRTVAALDEIPADRRADALVLFTAHSLPLAMARTCRYEEQLRETCRLVIEGIAECCEPGGPPPRLGSTTTRLTDPHSAFRTPSSPRPLGEGPGVRVPWQLVYQSRSGPPHQPWLEPDVCDFLERGQGTGDREQGDRTSERPLTSDLRPQAPPRDVVIVPIGFLSDHMEVVYDLDVEARETCDRLGINMVRAETVGTHPRFVRMIRELIVERMTHSPDRLALGTLGPSPDICPNDCCPGPPAWPRVD